MGTVILRVPGAASDSDSERARDRRRGGRAGSRSRSREPRRRGGSPDWSRWKGKSNARLVMELREQLRDDACCASGKEYVRRPMGFEAGLAVRREQGTAESQLIQEDTWASTQRRQNRNRQVQEDDEDRDRPSQRRTDEEQERQQRLRKIYEKYGQQAAGAAGGSSRGVDVEGPDVMRLG
uniref:Uncharacterized protein n=1 Tax=Zooxanthella nutricula TaxID=1333877 RepID=A0A7S2LXB5_9DINO